MFSTIIQILRSYHFCGPRATRSYMIVKIWNNSREHYQLHGPLAKLLQCCRHRETKENVFYIFLWYIKRSPVPRIYQTKELEKLYFAMPLQSHVILSHTLNPHLRCETKSICRFAKSKRTTIEHDIARAIRSESPIMIAISASRHGQQIVGVHGTVFKNQRTRYRDGSQHCVSISETRDNHPGWPLVLPSVSCAGTASRGPRPLCCIG